MTFNPTWPRVVCFALVCCLLSACGGHERPEGISPKQRFDVARAAEASGNMVLARSMYAAAASETADDPAMQLQAAEGLARTGAPTDAMTTLEAVLQRTPRDQDARRTLGSLQIMNGLPAKAVDTLSVVLTARPNDDTARVNKGVALDMLGRHAEAQKLYRASLERNPADPEAGNDLALSLLLSGQTAAAQAVLAPFRGRADLPERMRTTMAAVDNAAAGAPASSAPVSLKAKSPPVRKAARRRPVHPRVPEDQTAPR